MQKENDTSINTDLIMQYFVYIVLRCVVYNFKDDISLIKFEAISLIKGVGGKGKKML